MKGEGKLGVAKTSFPAYFMKKFEREIILASKSPRRKELMALTPWEFIVDALDVDETMDESLDLEENLKELAFKKAEPIAAKYPQNIVIGSDTIVYIDGQILGKPIDTEDAKRLLRLLSGKEHSVCTGVCIIDGNTGKTVKFCESTKVVFKELTEDEINWYAQTGEPMGKAGGYGIQGQGGLFVEGISGDYYNVVGLPINRVYEVLCGI